ncbi:high mobility group box, partial [Basidiobolus meristosporus CBS 931.73]
RPLNPFLLFRREKQAEIFNKYQGISNSQVSQILGQMWKSSSDEEKLVYQRMAEEYRKRHREKYPNYKY